MLPLLSVLAFAALALYTTAGQALSAHRLSGLVDTASAAGDLVHELQGERVAAAALLAGAPDATRMNAYLQQVAATDTATGRYQGPRSALLSVPAGSAALLARVDDDLAALTPLRKQVQSGTSAVLSAVTFQYRIVIADLLAFTASVAQDGAPADIADQIRATAALGQAGEYVALEQVAVLRAVTAGALTPAAQEEITGTRTGYTDSILAFGSVADPAWQGWLQQALTGDDVLTAQRMEDLVARTPVGGHPQVDTTTWVSAMAARIGRIQSVDDRINTAVLDTVRRFQDSQVRLASGEAAGVVGTVLTALVLGWWVGRTLIRRLHRMRDEARAVAYESLPGAVARLRTQGGLGDQTPDEFARRETLLPRTRGKDEITEVADAFAEVHRAALFHAAEQAQERASLGTMFVKLARRGEGLVTRLIRGLDEEERSEEDPDRLKRLFGLDNLATLMARTHRTLLVLGGQGTVRVRDHDVSLADVVNAALSRIELYPRIELRTVDGGVEIRRDAVDDLVHLLAELLDNATIFSPPDSAVRVDARWLGDRVLIQIADAGVGIPPDQLRGINARLAAPMVLDVTAVQAMGLTAVGRIAHLYRMSVQLRPGFERGTIAEVTLPSHLLAIETTPHGVAAGVSPVPATVAQPYAAPPPWPPLPHGRPSQPAVPTRAGRTALEEAARPGPGQCTAAEDTAEMPIYRELASLWFTEPQEQREWHTAADDGWRAAAKAATPPNAGTTPSGIPRRIPGAQLVPGAAQVPQAPNVVEQRDPRRTAASMAAFVRGRGAGHTHRPEQPTAPYPAIARESQ